MRSKRASMSSARRHAHLGDRPQLQAGGHLPRLTPVLRQAREEGVRGRIVRLTGRPHDRRERADEHKEVQRLRLRELMKVQGSLHFGRRTRWNDSGSRSRSACSPRTPAACTTPRTGSSSSLRITSSAPRSETSAARQSTRQPVCSMALIAAR